MKFLALFVFFSFGSWLAWRYFRIASINYEPSHDPLQNNSPSHLLAGNAEPISEPEPIPRTIWTYWHNSEPSPLVADCFSNWRRFAPNHQLIILTDQNLTDYLGDIQLPRDFWKLPPYRRSDWIRATFIYHNGGIWMDASTFLTRDLDWVNILHKKHRSQYVGYYVERLTHLQTTPVIENWFIAAPAHSPFMRDWLKELEHVLELPNESAYLEQLAQHGNYHTAIQRIYNPIYLVMHVAATRLLTDNKDRYRLYLLKAEEGPLFFLAALKWKKRLLYARLALCKSPHHMPPLVKLRGGERQYFERQMKRRLFFRSSAVGLYLTNTNNRQPR